MGIVQAIRRRERRAELAVLALVLVALLLGLALRQRVMSETVPFEAGDISGECPARWLRQMGDDPLLRAEDPLGGLFNTVLELRVVALAEEAEVALALDALALDRARGSSSYRALGTDTVVVGGETAMQRRFVYVYDDPNPYLQRLPVVVQGAELALRDDGRVIVATLLAAEDEFDSEQARFVDFVESLEY